MSQKTISFKLDEKRIEKINNVLDIIATNLSYNKGQCLIYLVDFYLNTKKSQEEPSYKADSNKPFPCSFLERGDDGWLCLADMNTKKKPVALALDVDTVEKLCKACSDGHSLAIRERQRMLLEKTNVTNLVKAVKLFQQLSIYGFTASVTMCKGNLLEYSQIIVSRDGETLKCPLLESKDVNINDVCKQTVNPQTQTTPCRQFVQIMHTVDMNDADMKDLKDILDNIERDTDTLNKIKALPLQDGPKIE